MLRARDAVCRYYTERDVEVEAEQVFLTTSTSEAYSWLFRLLCDAGDEVLIAQPSYPLFDFLAQIEDVRLEPYPLVYDHGWQIDFAGIAGAGDLADEGDCGGASEQSDGALHEGARGTGGAVRGAWAGAGSG